MKMMNHLIKMKILKQLNGMILIIKKVKIKN